MLASEYAPVGQAELGKFRLFKKKKKKKAPPPPPPAPAYPAYPGAPAAPGAPLTPEQQQAESSEVMKEFIKTAGQMPSKSKPQSSSVFISAATDHPYLFWGLIGGGSLLVVGIGLFFLLRKK